MEVDTPQLLQIIGELYVRSQAQAGQAASLAARLRRAEEAQATALDCAGCCEKPCCQDHVSE